MFFIISKLLIIFLYPLTWIIILTVLGIITKDQIKRRKLLIAVLVLLLFFTNPFLFDTISSSWDYPASTLKSLPNTSCIIVLGGFVSEDKRGEGYFNSASDRFMEALKLKYQHKGTRILVSGGNAQLMPTKFREADWVKSESKDFHINDSDILIDDRSRNSIENAMMCKKILDSNHLSPPYILVTSAYHMRRSAYIFRKIGIDIIPYPCNYIAGRERASGNLLIPEAGILGGWNTYLKELVGLLVYKLKN